MPSFFVGNSNSLVILSLALLLCSVNGEWFDNQAPTSKCPRDVPRIRRSWFSMDPTEKSQYQQLLLRLKQETLPLRSGTGYNSSLYNYFVDIHNQNTNSRDWHGTSFFLPAHRYFLYKFESALRWMARKYATLFTPPITDPCSITVPYWPWELDIETNSSDKVLPQNVSKIWEGGYLGVCRTGPVPYPFDIDNFPTVFLTNNCPNVSCMTQPAVEKLSNSLKRVLSPTVVFSYGPAQLANAIVNRSAYADFSYAVEGPHSVIHRWISFQMQSMASPDDPMFFLHHCNLDRLWALQQDCHGYESVSPALLDTKPLFYTPVVKTDGSGKPYLNYSIDDPIPFWWKTSRDSYPIPQAGFPKPRNVWSLGYSLDTLFDDMYVRYGPDGLVGVLNLTCPDKQWNLVNQLPPSNSKRAFQQNFTFTYDNSFYKVMDMAFQIAKHHMEQGDSSKVALQKAAYAECLATPPVVIDVNFLAWIQAQGSEVEQYDRICDSTSTQFFCRGLGRRFMRCPHHLQAETDNFNVNDRGSNNPLAVAGVFGGVVLAVVGIVFAVVNYRKGLQEMEMLEKEEDDLETNQYQNLNWYPYSIFF